MILIMYFKNECKIFKILKLKNSYMEKIFLKEAKDFKQDFSSVRLSGINLRKLGANSCTETYYKG